MTGVQTCALPILIFSTQKRVMSSKFPKEIYNMKESRKPVEVNNYCNRNMKSAVKSREKQKIFSSKNTMEVSKKKVSKELHKETPSDMLLRTIGANQLNTFGVVATDESTDEIEEIIEPEEKPVANNEMNYITPL